VDDGQMWRLIQDGQDVGCGRPEGETGGSGRNTLRCYPGHLEAGVRPFGVALLAAILLLNPSLPAAKEVPLTSLHPDVSFVETGGHWSMGSDNRALSRPLS